MSDDIVEIITPLGGQKSKKIGLGGETPTKFFLRLPNGEKIVFSAVAGM
jgi:hypothetical protein